MRHRGSQQNDQHAWRAYTGSLPHKSVLLDDMTGPVAELEMTLSLHSEPAQDQRRATNAGFVWLKAFGRHELRRSEAKRS